MSWGEAYRLFTVLVLDPSSQVAAAVAGWQHPIDRIDVTLRELFDLEHRSKSKKKPKPFPRPWDKQERRKIGGGRGMSIEAFEAIKAQQESES
jgi:hypothetical protein